MSDTSVRAKGRIPVILDTDLGDDIDDTWAIAMMLKSPELDVKLIVTATADTTHRARIVAKFLEVAGRTDIPIGIGTRFPGSVGAQGPWTQGYDLKNYPGKICEDGVGALIETIMTSAEPITLICIGPVPNIAEALRREPRIAQRAHFVGMHGSVRIGYGGEKTPSAEYNVKMHVRDCQEVFAAGWDMTITPLDTCGLIRLTGEKYQAIRRSSQPTMQALLEGYRHWCQGLGSPDFEVRSSVLFDTVAIYLGFAKELLVMEELPIRVSDDGMTVIDEAAGKRMQVATAWKDLAGFEDLLVQRLIG